ncbi:hypothetical protein FHX82_007136 [Amycolatopsis bartoniae]|uniref:Sensor domain-containing protein n=1 Tax=Amycolatopsis bartoniae TaxID=941986 RepID=A0A8H9MB02_9PSEU|nr:hypothetical protein [Amycolatopsis bartoniae]MBB2940050.1 hypothetical protein [Amycolatopsis bartoniae]TVT10012.1 hypothetical protein FNH07_07155 [Amycolatopsis bartoniae]GHF31763.1 hypothetical protein GCM10017566_00230 [Amycolatopsis bartoniae]
MKSMRPVWCPIIAAVAVAVTACGAVQADVGGVSGEPAIGPIPKVDSYDDLRFPLDSYHQTPEQRLSVKRADDVLMRDCLRRYGFDYELPDRTGQPALENRVIGIVDQGLATRYGYKPAGYLDHANSVKEAKSKQASWTPEMMSVLNGEGQSKINGVAVPEGGCSAEARTALGRRLDGKPGDENFVYRLEATAGSLAEQDSRVKAAFAKWSSCMAAAGFDYRDPWQANNDPAFSADVATQREIDTATTDVGCRAQHDVNGIWVAVETAYQEQLMAANAEALRSHRSASAEQLQKSETVLSGH